MAVTFDGSDCTPCLIFVATVWYADLTKYVWLRMTTWKHCERTIASLLGGVRTGCNGESRRDVEHPRWSIEVKHRKSLPEWLHSAMDQAIIEAEHRVPMVVLHEKQMKYEDSYVILRLKDFKEIDNEQQERVSDGVGKGYRPQH